MIHRPVTDDGPTASTVCTCGREHPCPATLAAEHLVRLETDQWRAWVGGAFAVICAVLMMLEPVAAGVFVAFSMLVWPFGRRG